MGTKAVLVPGAAPNKPQAGSGLRDLDQARNGLGPVDADPPPHSPRAGRLRDLQGQCVPVLHASGYWRGGTSFVLATSLVHGRHPSCPPENLEPLDHRALAAASALHVCAEPLSLSLSPALHGCGEDGGSACHCLVFSFIVMCPFPDRFFPDQGLHAIHDRGVCHGDIREENILVDEEDKVSVCGGSQLRGSQLRGCQGVPTLWDAIC